MAKHSILVIDDDAETLAFLEDYFLDTRSKPVVAGPDKNIHDFLKLNPTFLFLNPAKLSPAMAVLLEKYLSSGDRKAFLVGGDGSVLTSVKSLAFSGRIPTPIELARFEEILLKSVVFPEKMRVLIIDDEIDVCSGIQDFLELRRAPGFEVDFALNGLDGFEKIESFKPDVTILDIKMPVKSGHDLYREVQRKYRDLRIIILTAAAGVEEIEEIRKIGSPAFVEKGAERSAFPQLLTLIKKQWLFS